MKPLANPADLSDADMERQLQRSRQLEDAPEHVILRAIAAWQPRRQTTAAPSLLQRILAVLTFDSGAASPLAFGARSAGGAARQMLFSAEAHDVDLRIAPARETAADQWLLSGQLLGPDGLALVALTDAHGRLIGESALDEFGGFRLPAVAAGRYTVTLRLDGAEIELPPIDVPQAA
jgi:hypothetical protein